MPPKLINTYLERGIFDKAELAHDRIYIDLLLSSTSKTPVKDSLERRSAIESKEHIESLSYLDRLALMILAIAWSGGKAHSYWVQDRIKLQTVATTILNNEIYVACNGFDWSDVIFKDKGSLTTGLDRSHKKRGNTTVSLSIPNKIEDVDDPKNEGSFYYHTARHMLAKAYGSSGRELKSEAIPLKGLRLSSSKVTGKIRVNADDVSAFDYGATASRAGLRFKTKDRIQDALRDNGEFRNVKFLDHLEADTTSYHAEMQLVEKILALGIDPSKCEIGVSKPCCKNCAAILDILGVRYSTYSTFDPRARWKNPITGRSDIEIV